MRHSVDVYCVYVTVSQVCRQLDALTLLGPEHGSDKKILVLRK